MNSTQYLTAIATTTSNCQQEIDAAKAIVDALEPLQAPKIPTH